MKPVTLATDRLLLRPFEPHDVDDVFEYARDPEWGRYLPVPNPYEYDHAVAFVQEAMHSSWETNPVFALCLNGNVVGGINLEIDSSEGNTEIGYSIGRAYWGKGLVVEAVQVVLDWVLETFDLTAVSALVDVANTRSIRLLEKLGMHKETNCASKHVDIHQSPIDNTEVRYVILRENSQ